MCTACVLFVFTAPLRTSAFSTTTPSYAHSTCELRAKLCEKHCRQRLSEKHNRSAFGAEGGGGKRPVLRGLRHLNPPEASNKSERSSRYGEA